MDFELGEEEQAIRDLTAQVLDDMSSHERLKALAADGDHVDRKAWAALAATGVVGASVPEAHGGLGLGLPGHSGGIGGGGPAGRRRCRC